MKLKIKIHPNSSREKIEETNDALEVWIREKPENNKANLALTKLLKKHFKKDVKIKSGFASRNKIVEIK